MEVEIWSDVACPWCYVGKRRFENALAGFAQRGDVTVTWRSFELDPGAPRERPGDRAEHLARRYGTSVERARDMQDHIARVAAGDGLTLRFDRARGGSTFDAHRLIHLAAAHGRADAMVERLFRAHFTDGEPIGDPDALSRLSVDAGLPAEEVSETLAGDRFAAEVREDEQTAAALGIAAVPCFVADRAIAVSGAHEPQLLAKVLTRAYEARTAVPPEPQRPA